MAWVRDHEAPVRFRICCPSPFSARFRAVSFRRTRRRSLRPPQVADVVLWRLRAVLRTSAGAQLARFAIGPLELCSFDLCCPRAARDLPLLQLAREPRAAPAVGSRRTFLEPGRPD